jgi:hypothetical protein
MYIEYSEICSAVMKPGGSLRTSQKYAIFRISRRQIALQMTASFSDPRSNETVGKITIFLYSVLYIDM